MTRSNEEDDQHDNREQEAAEDLLARGLH